ncbi:MAG: hypothetical protein H0T84_02320 [Tatlockia sp.]|nr:hypothetical protein [Tatlockia sp.]
MNSRIFFIALMLYYTVVPPLFGMHPMDMVSVDLEINRQQDIRLYQDEKQKLQALSYEERLQVLQRHFSLLIETIKVVEKHNLDSDKNLALKLYNTVRVLWDQAIAQSFDELDGKWLSQKAYLVYNNVVLETLDDAQKIADFIIAIDNACDKLKNPDLASAFRNNYSTEALSKYNNLRQLAGLAEVQSLANTDYTDLFFAGLSETVLNQVFNKLPVHIQNKIREIFFSKHAEELAHALPIQGKSQKYECSWPSTAAIDPKGKFVITGSYAGKVKLWNLETLQSKQLIGHRGAVSRIAVSCNGKHIATGSGAAKDRMVYIVDLSTSKFKTLKSDARTLAVSNDGKWLLTDLGEHDACLYNLESLKCTTVFNHEQPVYAVAFNHDDTLVSIVELKGSVSVWNLRTLDCRKFQISDSVLPHSLGFSPDGKYLLIAEWGRSYLCNLSNQEYKELNTPLSKSFESSFAFDTAQVAFSHDSNYALTSSGGSVRLWNIKTLEYREFIFDRNETIHSLAFTQDDNQVLTTSASQLITRWFIPKVHTSLDQMNFITKMIKGTIDLGNEHNQQKLDSLAPFIDTCPQLPVKYYTTHPVIKAYVDLKRQQLLKAAAQDDSDTVKLLLKKGFNSLYVKDRNGNNLWHYAFKGSVKDGISYPSKKVIELLFQLEDKNKGLLKQNKAGLYPFAVGLMHNKEFTAEFIIRVSTPGWFENSRCSIQ